jgi:hypothetical protein
MAAETDIQMGLADELTSPVDRMYSFDCVPDHSYKKVKGKSGCQTLVGEKVCRRARHAPVHNLPTMNDTIARDPMVYQGAKAAWHPYLVAKLLEVGFPKGLSSVLVEGLYVAPTAARRDQGNHRAFIEKCMGDVLASPYCPRCLHPRNAKTRATVTTCCNDRCLGYQVDALADAWIPDDAWSFFEFGNFHYRVEKGVRRVEIRLMPNALDLF